MLRTLRIENFRCFRDHSLSFADTTVIVGKNNAGKSTIIESLQLLSTVTNRRGGLTAPAPPDLGLPGFTQCLIVGLDEEPRNWDTIFHRYGTPPAKITATFEGGAKVRIFIGAEKKLYAIPQADDRPVRPAQFERTGISHIYILPQIGPLLLSERVLTDNYVDDHLFSNLASRHFRNQLLRSPDEFAEFKYLAESTWPGLRIEIPETVIEPKGWSSISLFVKDEDFVAEVGWMGHGLQMWLQTIWFLSRTPGAGVVVLDEPDVYMHPDLQRKLYRLVRERFRQSIIATHSVEIMAEAEPSKILVVNKKHSRSRYTNSEPALQQLVDNIGGIYNVHLARLWNARKFLLVEGKDLAILKHLHARLFPKAELPVDALPNLPIGGWGGWDWAVGSSMTIQNAFGDRILTYCILDRDYHSDEQIEERAREARTRNVQLHIWMRKELENYLLVPPAIHRVILGRSTANDSPSMEEVHAALLRICDEERSTAVYGTAECLLHRNRGLGVSAHRVAEQQIAAVWGEERHRLSLVSGKAVLSALSQWSQQRCGVAFGPSAIARQLRPTEIPEEVKLVLEVIEAGEEFEPLTTHA